MSEPAWRDPPWERPESTRPRSKDPWWRGVNRRPGFTPEQVRPVTSKKRRRSRPHPEENA